MRFVSRGLPLVAVLLLILGFGCAQQEPVSYFVINPVNGQTEMSAPDIEKLKTTLDAFAAHYGMPKYGASQAGIIRYYRSTDDHEIGFFAKRDGLTLKVYANPMTPSTSGQAAYKEFRQNLATVLTQAFPGRVSLAKPIQGGE